MGNFCRTEFLISVYYLHNKGNNKNLRTLSLVYLILTYEKQRLNYQIFCAFYIFNLFVQIVVK